MYKKTVVRLSKFDTKYGQWRLYFISDTSNTSPTHFDVFSAHWLSTLADRLSPLSMVANPRKAPTRLYTTYEKIQLETVTHPGTNAPNVA